MTAKKEICYTFNSYRLCQQVINDNTQLGYDEIEQLFNLHVNSDKLNYKID